MAGAKPEPIATFHEDRDRRGPQLFLDWAEPEDKRVRITDGFWQRVRMSEERFADLVAQATAGALDKPAVVAV